MVVTPLPSSDSQSDNLRTDLSTPDSSTPDSSTPDLLKPDLDLRHLQTFLIVAEVKSFSRAAERLGVSQPPLSRQIQRLEAKLNVKLFDRSRSQIQLTAAGQVFAHSAQRILAQVKQGIYAAQQVSQGLTGEVKVGIDGRVINCDRILQFLHHYQTQRPNLHIHIQELAASAQVTALQAHDISLGLVAPWELSNSGSIESLQASSDWTAQMIAYDSLSVVLPALHPLAIASHLSWRDLAEQDAIMHKHWHQYLSHLAQQQQETFTPNIVQSASTYRLILSCVAADQGIAIVPSAIEQQISQPNIVFKPLTVPHKVGVAAVIWRTNETNPSLTALLQALSRTES